jgi:hypothetical protein
MIQEYKDAFNACYPHKSVDVVPVKQRDRSIKYRVVIDHDRGDILLSEDDMQFATRMFKRGR